MTSLHETNPPLRLLAAFQQTYPKFAVPTYVVQPPGREMWVAASLEEADEFTIHAPDFEARTAFNWRSAKSKQTVLKRPLPGWARYPAGVIYTLCADGLDVDGFHAIVVGDESKGLRYDYSLGLTFAALLYTIHDKPYTRESLMDIVDRVRRDYVED